MAPAYTFFYLVSFVLLWVLSVASGIAVVLSWINIETEFDEEGVLTQDSRCLVRARAWLTVGCMVFWICTVLGYALTSSLSDSNRTIDFGFWQEHFVLLLTLFLHADLLLILSVVFAWQSRSSRRWTPRIATLVIALASIASTVLVFLSALVPTGQSF